MVKTLSLSDNTPRKWTVATVHWKSLDYLYWQLRMLYEYNNPAEFELVIFDAMYPIDDTENLVKLCENYLVYKNIKIYAWENYEEKGCPHGSEMTHLLKICNSQFVLFNEPDHFWLIKDYLKTFNKFFDLGYRCLGVEHNLMKGLAIWGSAYHVKDIQDCNLEALWMFCKNCDHPQMIPNYDTGWRLDIRTANLPQIKFIKNEWQPTIFGKYSYGNSKQMQSYSFGDQLIAVHMFRGIYPIEKPTELYPEFWKQNRKKYGSYFHGIVKEFDECSYSLKNILNK